MSPESQKNKAFSDAQEVKKFSEFAQDWWNPNGKMKPLHRINPVRVDYIRDELCCAFGLDSTSKKPLAGLSILDVGCGGGLLSESLSILGASVVGIDASDKMISVATLHAKQSNVVVDYRSADVTEIASSDEKFDVVMSLEVIEHVSDPEQFAQTCAGCIKEGGHMFISTINRTMKSYALAIVGAEYVMKWLPKGTHDWHKFLKPSEIVNMVRGLSVTAVGMAGLVYNLFDDSWKMSKGDLDVNYLIHFKK